MRFTWDQGSSSFRGYTYGSANSTYVNPSGITHSGVTPGGITHSGATPGGIIPGRVNPNGAAPGGITSGAPTGWVNPGGTSYMGVPNTPYMGGANFGQKGFTPGGSIRNSLGSKLKELGIFQKDGQIKNLRGGFFGAKPYKSAPQTQGGESMGVGPFSFLGSGGGAGNMVQPRQMILETTQAGINANGIASISPDNVFSCIANLPSPNTLLGWGNGTYAVYLVDNKGQTGFLAGTMRPVGNGVYQTQFRSQVPLNHYNRVLVTLENPMQLRQVPQGPVILQVKQPPGPIRFLAPLKKAGGAVWSKVTGLVQKKVQASEGGLPEGGSLTSGEELMPGSESAGVNPGAMNSGAGNYGTVNPGMVVNSYSTNTGVLGPDAGIQE